MTTTILDDSTRIPGVLKSLSLYKNNPAGIQRVGLQHLKDVTNGLVDIVDPTTPFVFCMENSAVNTASFMIENEANMRRLYPSLSQTSEDLYLHMSDKDFIDRFATPAKTVFSIMIQEAGLLDKMIDDPETGGKKITIPRNTEFVIADTTFSLQYPIDIKQLSHGGIQIVYDTSIDSPLQTLVTNVITSEERTDATGVRWIYFEVDVTQFKINSTTAALSPATGFNQTISITDQFYFARVYFKNTINGVWKEIYTTHTDQVYDAGKVTAVFKLIDKTLNVSIPQIYLNSGLIQGTLRIDVYETKGPINMIMTNYALSSFSANWKNIDKTYDTVFTSAITNIPTYPYSSKTINDGFSALTYTQLRDRVINNTIGPISVPITNVQIESTLEKKGYSVVTDTDVVTNRVFLATKALPKPINEKLITAGASSIETLIMTIDEAITYDGVINNGVRVTLTPDIVYYNDSGVIKIFPKSDLNALLASSADNIATVVTANNYLYTPFHYVLDTSGNQFKLRPYFLNKPVAKSVRFIAQNETTGLQINTKSYSIEKIDGGYRLTIVTKSNDAAKAIDDTNVFVQLSYIPTYEVVRGYLNGVLSGKTADNERVYTFDLSSNLDLDSSDNLVLNQFSMFSNTPRLTFTPLAGQFDILYSTNAVMPSTLITGTIDDTLGKFILPSQAVGVTQEKININFGYSLNTLWARSRSVVQAAVFEKHTVNIPWLYSQDVYKQDPVTGAKFSVVGGVVTFTKLHSAGDPILDSLNQPTYQYMIGDIVLDNAGVPVPLGSNKITRQIDIMFIEGAYYFATDAAAATYRSNIVDTVVSWLVDDLTIMGNSLLEKTELFFYPKTTMGSINIIADDGLVTTIEAGQHFTINYYVSKAVYQNDKLREKLRVGTISRIDTILQDPNISMNNIVTKLTDLCGDDVISFDVSGLGGNSNLTTVSVTNPGQRCNIRKRLVKLPDNSLIVQEDITINFIKHEVVTT